MPPHATRLNDNVDAINVMRLHDQMGRQSKTGGTARARSGFRPDGGGVVSAPGGMSVSVSPFMGWIDGTTFSEGGYTFISDPTGASTTVTIPDGPPSGSTVHTVCAVVENAAYGGGVTLASVKVLSGAAGAGTPASVIPDRYLPIRDITVPAGRNAGNGGITTGEFGVDRRVYTVALGGVTPVDTSEYGSISPYTGYAIYNKTTDQFMVYEASEGTYIPYSSDMPARTYTPDRIAGTSGSALALGNGTMIGEYFIHGRRVTVRIGFIVGSTTALGSGPISFSLPTVPIGPLGGSVLRGRNGQGQATIINGSSAIATAFTPQVLGLATGSPWNAVHQNRIVGNTGTTVIANTHFVSGYTMFLEMEYMYTVSGE